MITLTIWQLVIIAVAAFCIGVAIRVYIAAGKDNDTW